MSSTAEPRTVAFLGGRGSFSEEACQRLLPDCRAVPYPGFGAVAGAVLAGDCDVGVLPVRNTVAGPIEAAVALAADPRLRTLSEGDLEVRFHLLGVAGSRIEQIRSVASHPAALSQCAAFIAKRGYPVEEASSTSDAARELVDAHDPSRGAIASLMAAEMYGLDVLVRDIQGAAANITSFAVIALAESVFKPDGITRQLGHRVTSET